MVGLRQVRGPRLAKRRARVCGPSGGDNPATIFLVIGGEVVFRSHLEPNARQCRPVPSSDPAWGGRILLVSGGSVGCLAVFRCHNFGSCMELSEVRQS